MLARGCPYCIEGRQQLGKLSILCGHCRGTGSRELARLLRAREIGFREGIAYAKEVCEKAVPVQLDPQGFYRMLEREEAVELE